eukprot:GEMP01069702.1.p1 GENE.GEMP01069702.1~~GEMP01069702.1.p1  ORF type:complete len:233 (+),score=50.47 GEMP01069702.1:130-828(+)
MVDRIGKLTEALAGPRGSRDDLPELQRLARVHATEEVVKDFQRENTKLRRSCAEAHDEKQLLLKEYAVLQENCTNMRASLLQSDLDRRALQQNVDDLSKDNEHVVRALKEQHEDELINCRGCTAKQARVQQLQVILERRSKALQEEEAENNRLRQKVIDWKAEYKACVAQKILLERSNADLSSLEEQAKSAMTGMVDLLRGLADLTQEDLAIRASDISRAVFSFLSIPIFHF